MEVRFGRRAARGQLEAFNRMAPAGGRTASLAVCRSSAARGLQQFAQCSAPNKVATARIQALGITHVSRNCCALFARLHVVLACNDNMSVII